MGERILEIRGISKSFGAVQVLKKIDLDLDAGSVLAICGENGAGKSTLMKILAGVHPADAGRILLQGKEFSPKCPQDALKCGISMIYQELDLAEDLTVMENIFLGCEKTSLCGLKLDARAMREETLALIQANGFELDPDARVADLSVGQSQIVVILKALHDQAKILVMDEPTSALSDKEAKQLFRIIAQLRDQGMAIIYISHRMEEIMQLANRVAVLRDGEMIRVEEVEKITIPEIIRAMVGRELNEFYPPRNAQIGDVVFEVAGLTDHKKVQDVSFQVRAGEIVGMAGLVGAGRTEVANAIFGITPGAGKLLLNGKAVKVKCPSDAIQAGIGYLTEDRKRTGLCLGLPCVWNVTLPNLDKLGMKAVLRLKKEINEAATVANGVHIKWNDAEDAADTLSGGNQQKLLLARWLMADSQFLIFDEPTRGIDVGAKKEVYALLNGLAEAGKAILLISSDMQELFGMTDRMLVMREGRITADLKTAETTQETVMKYGAINMD